MIVLFFPLLLQTAQPAKSAKPSPPTPVEGVTVTAPRGDAPTVASAWPAQGAAVAGGTMVLKTTFSQPMSASGWRYVPVEGAAFPRCLDRPRLLADGRTFVLMCVTTADGSWGVRLQGPGGGEPGFVAAGGKPLATYDLKFTTTGDRPVASLADAMTAASLSDDQSPIMDDKAQAAAGAPKGSSPNG